MGGLTGPVLVATRNSHKLSEIREILASAPIRILGLADLGLPELAEEAELEPFSTFEQNALSKARYFHHRSGVPTLADDSGLCVDALGGGPGVRTRRFAPEDWARRFGRNEANNLWLIHRLDGIPTAERRAHYRCCVAIADDLEYATFDGRVDGVIGTEARGDGGFGYDPLFIPNGGTLTYAELPAEAKRQTSHRSTALRAAFPWLRALSEGRSGP